MKLNSTLQKNRDVHLFLRLIKAFNDQRVIFRLLKVCKTAEFHCAVFLRKYIPSAPHKSLLKLPKAVKFFQRKTATYRK